MVIQSNGKILVGGSFSNYNGESVHGIIRLNTDGTRDNTFNSLVGTTVEAIAIQSDGKILVGGGTSKNLVRLTTTGSQDASFNV
ncbi:MAG: delta-60 repeat domain-containing protein [bacterium]